jgi:soluble lytic murein transglycosylase-like protein
MKISLAELRLPSRSRVAALLGWAAVAIAPPSHADIFKSVDESGVVSFTSRPTGRGSHLVARDNRHRSTAVPAVPHDQSPQRFSRFDLYIRQAAALYQIPEELVRAVIMVESGFDPAAVSPMNAQGLMQLMPATAERMMVTDIFDPRENVFGGTRYLRVLANLFNGDLELTIAGYNAGENAVIRHGGIPPYEETRDYVVKVLGYYRLYRNASARR